MKKILIIAKKMESGGTEVSLLNTIKELQKYDVNITLALLEKKGVYLEQIPNNIKILEILNIAQNRYFDKTNFKNLNILMIIKIIFMKILRKIDIEKCYDLLLKRVNAIEENFDLAIDFHGYGYFGTPYVIEKINARKKITFIHDENIQWIERVKKWINKFDSIYCVSNACKDSVKGRYPFLEKKLDVFRNIIDGEKIDNLLLESIPKLSNKVNLLTIGRLEYQKGYDLLIQIANKLDKNKFTWYIIGTGSLYKEIKKQIELNRLENNVILLGMKKNPYPYIKECDIYIQTSRHEGYGIAIAEARYLNKPIIATNLACIREQIKDRKTGILCEFNGDDFLKNINDLINDKEKCEFYSNNLKREEFKDNNDIKKILEE